MSTLLIRHLENSDPPRFQVIRAADVKATVSTIRMKLSGTLTTS